MTYEKVLKIKPREYQKAIFETAKNKNTLVVLPTGTGKTLIAQMIAIDHFEKNPLEKIVILAPTRPLIEQHLKSFQESLPEGWADMQLFTGKTPSDKRKKIWQTAEFIFSTPQCIANDLTKRMYSLEDVSLLIVDEAHRCLKNYAYNKVAERYKAQRTDPRILALTASPGSDKKTIQQVCENLAIDSVEIRTRDSPDVKPYLQELDFEKIEVDFPPEFLEIKKLLESIYYDKIEELKHRRVAFGYINKVQLLKKQSQLMTELKRKKDFNKMAAVSACAQALKISHAIELLETQTLSSLIEYMKGLFQQSAEKKSKGVQKLTQDRRFTKAYEMAITSKIEHPKLETLKKEIEKRLHDNPKAKIIIFAQFRDTISKIKQELDKIEQANPEIFVGQAIKKNSKGQTTGLKQREQKEMIQKFKSGEMNILLATSIAEEGLDIPEVSEVIFYEPVPSAIRKIQRAGRTARLAPGQLKILITKNTRDQAYHYASFHKEKRMHKAISDINDDFEKGERQKKLSF